MIGKRQLALIRCACEKLDLSEESIARMLKVAGAPRVEDLTKAGFELFMDQCTVLNFRDPRRPVLSKATMVQLETLFKRAEFSSFQRATLLRAQGRCGEPRDLDGMGLIRMLVYIEKLGTEIHSFNDFRRSCTDKQIAFLQFARRETAISEETYSGLLQWYGGVNTASDLDQRGFDLVIAYLRYVGFEDRKEGVPSVADFGERPGFASGPQLRLIRELWAEWSDGADEAGLVTWLERSYQVSALRFLKADTASKAITALKAMKFRKARAAKVSA